jgi:hypothetical protein
MFSMADVDAPRDTFNPWRIVIPAVAGLLVIFAVVYALTRSSSTSGTDANNNSAPLAVDPGSQPVKPAQTPTGEAEQNIAPNTTQPTPDANGVLPAEPNLNRNESTGTATGNRNENTAASGNYNPGDAQPSPTPEKNTNRPELPTPRLSPKPDSTPSDTPPPPPMPKKEQTPASKPPGDGGTQQPGAESGNPQLP